MTQHNNTSLYQPEIETLSRNDIHAVQLEKLKKQVAMVYEKVEWYRNKMDEMGVSPSDIQTLEDVKKLPFTDKTVLRDTFPYGLFAVPLDEIIELHASSGTTGKPIVVGYTHHDMDVWSDCIARLAMMAGVKPGDRCQMAFGYGMFTGGFGIRVGCPIRSRAPQGSETLHRHKLALTVLGQDLRCAYERSRRLDVLQDKPS